MFISVAVYILHSGIDKHLSHEIEKVIATIEVKDTVINIIDFSELNEKDFNTISENSFFLQIYDQDGNILISSNNLKKYGTIPIKLDVVDGDFSYEDIELGEDRFRTGYLQLRNDMGEAVAILQLAMFENELRFIRNKMIMFNLFLLPGIIIIVIIASVILAKKNFKPVNTIIDIAERISAKNLESRIEYNANPNDELGRLRDTLNGLFNRIESYVNKLSQFTDHASHQLMNPLTAAKTELEFILKKDRTPEEYRQSLKQLLVQTDNMIRIVRTLLMLSKQDTAKEPKKTIFNLSKLLQSIVPSQINTHQIKKQIENDIYVKGDSEKFSMVLENLIDNAVKYSPDNEMVKVILQSNDENVELKIEDKGIGIEDSEKENIFDRFYRSKIPEMMGVRGYGLGLSLVKTILEEMGAKIRIEDNHPTGSKFIITIKALKIE